MNIKEKIEILETEIAKHDFEIKNVRRDSKKQKILMLRNKAVYEIETLLMNYLELNDSTYKELLNMNFDLLINDRILFKVSAESGLTLFPEYSNVLEGKINENGYLYLTTKKTRLSFANEFPTSYVGILNCFGEANVIAESKNYRLFGSRIPESFIGSIDYDGNIKFKTATSYWKTKKTIYIRKIIADPFSGDNNKRTRFLRNRIKLIEILNETRKNNSY